MSKNVGGADQLIRLVLGVALLGLGFMHILSGTWTIVAFVVGAVALFTGLARFCPAWSVMGINTYKVAHK